LPFFISIGAAAPLGTLSSLVQDPVGVLIFLHLYTGLQDSQVLKFFGDFFIKRNNQVLLSLSPIATLFEIIRNVRRPRVCG
jgi:hypothetical protein